MRDADSGKEKIEVSLEQFTTNGLGTACSGMELQPLQSWRCPEGEGGGLTTGSGTCAQLDFSQRCLNQDTPQDYGSQNGPALQTHPGSSFLETIILKFGGDQDSPDP